MSVKITYFVHGTTTDNEAKICTGWNQGELSKLGISQAKELGKIISDKKFDYIFTSDLKRAIDSAKLVFKNKETIVDDRLRECNYGIYNGKSKKYVKYIDHTTEEFEGGESLLKVEKRMKDFCNFLLENYNNKHIAIVAHRAPQLALEVITKNIDMKEAINNDWRKTGAWKPGFEYIIEG